jgi:hypothetical protein
VAGKTPEPTTVVQEALNHGQVTVDAPGGIPPSDEVLHSVVEFMNRRIRDEVRPVVEDIILEGALADEEGGGLKIGDESAHHVEIDVPVHLPSGEKTLHVDCEITPKISEEALDEVGQVLEDELKKPLKQFLSRRMGRISVRDDDAAKERFVKTVRSVMGDFGGRGA